MKYAFAGNREIAYNILEFLTEQGHYPSALLVVEDSPFSDQLINISLVEEKYIFKGKSFTQEYAVTALNEMELDYIIGIHFPYIIPPEVLAIPKIGVVNLHPAFLPYNRGWHTPSWAILDSTKYGATLHFMSSQVDMGDIISQKELKVMPEYTAHQLYLNVLKLEEELFKESLPLLLSLDPPRIQQNSMDGNSHSRKNLSKIQEVSLDESVSCRELINKLRALTTNNIDEAAFFVENNKKYAMQIKIKEI